MQQSTARRRGHLALAPEPGAVAGIPVPGNLPDDPTYAYRLGRIATLTETLDEQTRAVANFDRFESMSFAEISTLIEVLGWFADAKRPSLHLVDEQGDIAPIVQAAVSEFRPVDEPTRLFAQSRARLTTFVESHVAAGIGGVS
jgi:hypothetical protein